MTAADVVDRLADHKTMGGAPRSELEWLAAHGSIRHLNAGEVLTPKGKTVDGLYIVLSGRISISVDRGTGPHKIMEWRQGDVTGVLPYSRIVSPPGDTVAEEATEVFAVARDQLHTMIRECHSATSILVHTMVDRARVFNAADLHDEKMMSLGKLSAGLAHELNNPAAAIERTARLLEDRMEKSETAGRALGGGTRLTDEQLAALDAVRVSCLPTRDRAVRSPLAQAEREEAIADWLVDHHLDPAIADELSETGATLDTLDRLASTLDQSSLEHALRWVSAGCSARSLVHEIQEAATRIAVLVGAIKGFTHMDQATVAGPVDVKRGLADTVTVLRSKARDKSATVAVDVESDLPNVLGFAAELNQIWANLIDNALDAIPDAGRIDVHATRDRQRVVVSITDNGSGIPDQVRERIFDPFFTTKPVGQGMGLGLDIVRRLVRHNDGEISVESRPGRTEFRVALPVVVADGAGARP
jgi:signal transduction histidine kinase